MKQIINGKTYNTDTAYVYHSLDTESSGAGDVKVNHHRTIYETRTGNYFIHHITHHIHHTRPILDRTDEWIEPITKEEAWEM